MKAISATFVQLRPINGRKVVQIVLEAPNEHADAILQALGGYPKPDDPQWVGVAPLDADAAQKPAETRKGGKLAQRAGIMCGSDAFYRYIKERRMYAGPNDAEAIADFLRATCRIGSRVDLDHDADAAMIFQSVENGYRDWMRS